MLITQYYVILWLFRPLVLLHVIPYLATALPKWEVVSQLDMEHEGASQAPISNQKHFVYVKCKPQRMDFSCSFCVNAQTDLGSQNMKKGMFSLV